MTFTAAKCTGCGADIIWTVTAAGKRMPVDATPVGKATVLRTNPHDALSPFSRVVDQFVSHFATCPKAAAFRSSTPPAHESKPTHE